MSPPGRRTDAAESAARTPDTLTPLRLPPFPVDRPRRAVAQRLVRALLVVEPEVLVQPLRQRRHPLVAPQVNVLILHAPPQPLDEHIVQAPSTPIHTHLHP